MLILASAASALLLFLFLKTDKRTDADEEENNVVERNELSDVPVFCVSPRNNEGQGGYSVSVSMPPHVKRELMKERKRKEKTEYLAMKSPMYDNVHMLDPHGENMNTISLKKGHWYVNKGLAEWTDNDKRCIKLCFEPKNKSNRGEKGLYARSDKKNICVVCGHTEYHMRHYVVPYSCRTLLPDRYKTHLSHDIVLLCVECQVVSDQARQKRMKEMEEDLRPYDSEPQFAIDHNLSQVRSKAMALLRQKHKLPADRIVGYDHLVRSHLKLLDSTVELTPEQLQKAISVNFRIEKQNYISGPDLIVKNLNENDKKISAFVKGWRQHFVDTMHPRYLPIGWSVENAVVCGSD